MESYSIVSTGANSTHPRLTANETTVDVTLPANGASQLKQHFLSLDFLSTSANLKICSQIADHTTNFYPRDAMLARVIAIATCLSVRPSVSLSRAGIVSKRRKLAA